MSRTAEIAKTIRADLKAAFPGVKFSVRTSVFSGGSSINVDIVSAPITIHRAEFVAFEKANPTVCYSGRRWTPEAAKMVEDVKRVAARLHEDSSDRMTDYFCCNFYLFCGFSSEFDRTDRARVLASIAPIAVEEFRAAAPVESEQVRFLAMMGC